MQEVARGMLACECGAEGRLKQEWVFGRGGLERRDLCCTGCHYHPWPVFQDRPFETTVWREDLIACGCGADGRLEQAWSLGYNGRVDKPPYWHEEGTCAFCTLDWWPVVPGVPVSFPAIAGREPQAAMEPCAACGGFGKVARAPVMGVVLARRIIERGE